MLMSVSELRQYITTDETDKGLAVRLQALESLIRAYTNNNFQLRAVRGYCKVDGSLVIPACGHLRVGDTVQISESLYNNGLYTVIGVEADAMTLDADLDPEEAVLVTKVAYPEDVKLGAVQMIKWDMGMRDKAGIQSETISRHSVTYANMDGTNALCGYPRSLLGFLRPYQKARFGKGVGV